MLDSGDGSTLAVARAAARSTSTRPAASATRSRSTSRPLCAARRRLRADDLGPRARPHRRHARQAGGDPRLSHRARAGGLPARARAAGFVLAGQSARLAPADRPPLRAARRDRHRRVDPAHRLVDPLEEARRGDRRAGARRQGRQRRVPADAEPGPDAGPHAGRARPAPRACGCARCSPTWTSRSAPRSATPSRCARRSRCCAAAARPTSRALTVRLGAEMLVLGGVARDRATARRRDRARRSPAAPGSTGFASASACRAATRA